MIMKYDNNACEMIQKKIKYFLKELPRKLLKIN